MNAEVETNRMISMWHHLLLKQTLLEGFYGLHALRIDLSKASALFLSESALVGGKSDRVLISRDQVVVYRPGRGVILIVSRRQFTG